MAGQQPGDRRWELNILETGGFDRRKDLSGWGQKKWDANGGSLYRWDGKLTACNVSEKEIW